MVKDKPTGIITSFEILEEAKKRFDQEGIVIPFPQRTLTYKSDIDKAVVKKMHSRHSQFMPPPNPTPKAPAKRTARKKTVKKKAKKKTSKKKRK